MKRHTLTMLVHLSILLLLPSNLAAGDGRSPGIQELYRLDRLPELRESVEVASLSSYDRTGGNNDGFGGEYSFVRKEENGLVLADLKGPGIIYRIWTPTPTDDVMEFYFDGNREPAIKVKFRDLFMGRHPAFVRPLVGYGAGGFYSYVPLPYSKSCKVLIRAKRIQFYQINYATYPQGTPIKSHSPNPDDDYLKDLEAARTLFGSAGSDMSSYAVPPGGIIERFNSRVRLRAGTRQKIFEVSRPGRIVGLRLGPAEAFANKRRDIVLRAYWDGDKEPAILSP
ncbi:MAG: DUF2961 domain-containing protein, partial [Phycisphaerales bacterium]